MPTVTHLGEIEDGKVYTEKRLAQIFGRHRDWVIDNFIFPEDGSPGVPCTPVGSLYQVSGEALRLWLEERARAQPRKPAKGRAK